MSSVRRQRRLHTYAFHYGEEGTMYDPQWPIVRVRARSMAEARRRAAVKAHRLLQRGQVRWEWTGNGPWVRVPPRVVKGGLLPGSGWIVEAPATWRKRMRQLRERAAKPFTWPAAMGGSREAFASFISAPILQAIESAPAIADLFKGHTFESSGPSIPLVHTSYSPSRPTAPPVMLQP
jgi:hypothetical protein